MDSILIIETSTPAASVALVSDGGIVAEIGFVSDRRHNALLFGPLAEIMKIHGSRVFDTILVGSGPGSYSGTRVGIAAAQGAALVAGCKAVAVPSILSVPACLSGNPCLAVGDARRGSFWHSQIDRGHMINGPGLIDEIGFDAAVENSREQGMEIFCMEKIHNKSIPLQHPTASGLWMAWKTASAEIQTLLAARIPQPIYLKPPHITESRKKSIFG
ncbi:MAG: tRNA (adenosine(37)-N6)-threonylcarbamoyltransferase complex dimerization subunit type 1 TsaB [Armatimonadetes bacterium]|nr:tRNA (adenosine(37)-N6)-threonylcarbamoyltransferase complex dimerization subunit type 1 TsaB [Akkermansiaceae bacterium]